MIENGLLGKVVKTNNYHFIGFLYPDFRFVGHVLFIDNDVPGIIYTGGEHLYEDEKAIITNLYSKEYIIKQGIPFISTYSADGQYDIDLTGINGRKTILNLLYSKWGLNYKQYLDIDMIESLLHIDEQHFYDFIKVRWIYEEKCVNSKDIDIYNSKSFFKLLNRPIEGIYTELFSIKSDSTLDTLELSIANYITDSKYKNYNSYKKDDHNVMLNNFDNITKGKEKKIASVLSKYRNMNHHKKIKLIWLIMELKKLIEWGE